MGVIYQDYISCQAYSQCTIFGCLGVLLEVLYHFCGSAPTRVVRETCLLIREYSQCLLGPFLWEHSHKHGIAVLGVLPKTQNNYYWEYSQTCLKSGRSNLICLLSTSNRQVWCYENNFSNLRKVVCTQGARSSDRTQNISSHFQGYPEKRRLWPCSRQSCEFYQIMGGKISERKNPVYMK